jgi:N-acetylmuramoyl-L-alanine amidase
LRKAFVRFGEEIISLSNYEGGVGAEKGRHCNGSMVFSSKICSFEYFNTEVKAVDTRELFARILKCEAEGEGENGMKAVATVIMNRVKVPYGEYRRVCEGDVRKVIEQQCQFSCLKTVIGGAPNPQNVWVMTPDKIQYDIVDWAMNGGVYTGVGNECLWYMNPFRPKCPDVFPYNGTGYWFTRIQQHCFYNPTSAYADT